MENMNYANKAAEAEARKQRYASSKKNKRPEMNLRAKLDAELGGSFNAAEKVGNLTYADIAAICGTAAAERMFLTRRSRNNEVPAIAGTETAVRGNLACALVKRGVVVTDEMASAIYEGNYDKLLHEAGAKPYIIDDIMQAQQLERDIVDKRERQLIRGAASYSDDKTNAVLAGAAYAALVVSSVAAVIKKLAK